MKILNICDADPAGVAFRLTEAVRQCAEHRARHIRMVPHKFEYPYDIQTRDPKQVRRWVEWADVVTVHDTFRPLRQKGSRQLEPTNLTMLCHCGMYGETRQECERKDAEHNVKRRMCTNAHMVILGAEWLPIPVPVERYAALRRKVAGKPIVCQAPTSERKNITEVRNILSGRRDIRLQIIENTPHEECLRLKANAAICVDQFRLGYGTNALEAWAMGIPVIAHAEAWAEECILKEVGYLPYYDASLNELSGAVDHLLSHPNIYTEYAERGREYVKEFHDYPKVAGRYTQMCEEAMST